MDIVLAGSKDGLVMVEAGAKEVPEEQVAQALEAGHAAIKQIVAVIDDLAKAAGKPKRQVTAEGRRPGPAARGREQGAGAADRRRCGSRTSSRTTPTVDQVQEQLLAGYAEAEPARKADAKAIFKELKEKVLREEVLERRVRLDGRKFDEIRPIWTEAGVLPRTHGSVVFTRGETQALVTCTLGTADDQQKIEHVDGEYYKRFMLHYNFPPFSVGEVQFMRGPGRREVGHGALAERALTPVVPAEDKFPYTIRLVSDILESNGSSSMASVCGGSMSMMDAGVPLSAPVAGIAMGLIIDESIGQVRDPQRHRRRRGSLRRHGLQGRRHRAGHHRPADGHQGHRHHRRDHARGARAGARRPRAHPRQDGRDAVGEPRKSVSSIAPRIVTIKIPVDKIRDVIGPGGKMIRSIIERTGVKIDVEDDGRVNVASADEAAAAKAIGIIQELTATPELNKTYMGKVQRITDFGAFVEIMPGTDGLLHVSEIANHRVKDVRDELKEGEQVLVKVINIDPTGKIRLSRKALLNEEVKS